MKSFYDTPSGNNHILGVGVPLCAMWYFFMEKANIVMVK